MRQNSFGEIVAQTWNDLPNHNPHLERDVFVVMPNHVPGILVINQPAIGADTQLTLPVAMGTQHALPEIVRQFKTFSGRAINILRGTVGVSVWQRNYDEHVTRNDQALNRIRQYIVDNPMRWHLDRKNVQATGTDPSEEAWFKRARSR